MTRSDPDYEDLYGARCAICGHFSGNHDPRCDFLMADGVPERPAPPPDPPNED